MTMEEIRGASLFLSWPSMVFSVAVVWLFASRSFEALREGMTQSRDWLILGVVLGFVASAFMSAYMVIPETMERLGHEDLAADWRERSLVMHFLFRQGLGTASAFCHLTAFATMQGTRGDTVRMIMWVIGGVSIASGLVFVGLVDRIE